jgi:hypothetical protein
MLDSVPTGRRRGNRVVLQSQSRRRISMHSLQGSVHLSVIFQPIHHLVAGGET